MSIAYYNEFDPKAAAWLRELIRQGLIAPGDVDERSIVDVQPDDLRGYAQCHFFAGIGGWSYALRLAGWPDERPVWTGSCPCQPFSSAGKRRGTADSRHLWPEFYRLIKACRPAKVFGEQVASAEVVGTELEASFVVAVQRGDFARANKLAKRLAQSHGFHFAPRWVDGVRADLEAADYAFRFMVLGAHSVCAPHIRQRLYWMADAERHGGRIDQQERGSQGRTADGGLSEGDSRMGDATGIGQHVGEISTPNLPEQSGDGQIQPWSDFYLVHCRDGKTRRIKSGVAPLAHGVPARVVRLRGYGNAIVPQLAAEFIQACEEAVKEQQ
ncbi:MAG TPA: DNA cytosine methyltransferase [Aggregatilineales bacterium]|nr:DNA cytosine methyltransferase [Aggregatilineales bacterium]